MELVPGFVTYVGWDTDLSSKKKKKERKERKKPSVADLNVTLVKKQLRNPQIVRKQKPSRSELRAHKTPPRLVGYLKETNNHYGQ